MKGVMPPFFHFLKDFGIYVFRFYKNDSWIYVTIDDRIPILQSDALAFASTPFDSDS